MNTTPNETEHEGADADVAVAQAPKKPSPLDRALNAPRGRPAAHSAPEAFDHPAALTTPAQALYPAQVTALPDYDEQSSPVPVRAAAEALAALQGAVTQVIAARTQLKGNASMSPAEAVLAVADLQSKVNRSASLKVDNAMAAVNSAIQERERILNQPMNENARGPFAGEIRAVLRALPVAERMAAIDKAISDGDATLFGAVAGAPPVLTGIQVGTLNVLAHKWHAARNPSVTRELALLRATATKLEQAGSHLIGSLDAVLGATSHQVERLRAAKAAAAKVLA